jgi:hypothetical protein
VVPHFPRPCRHDLHRKQKVIFHAYWSPACRILSYRLRRCLKKSVQAHALN